MITLLEAQRAGLFVRRQWLPNIVAGIIVGVVALPLAMAFAIASGVRPEQGLYTAIVAGLCVSLFGGSRLQIAGPTGAFVAILASITAKYGMSGLTTATFMAGIILVLMGIARMGAVIRFIPAPVIVGFTAGIALIIFVGQWSYFLGLPTPHGEHFHERFWELLLSMSRTDLSTLGLGLVGLLLVIYSPRVRPLARIPAPLLAMTVVTALQAVFQFPHVATLGSAFGGIPRGLPGIHVPDLSLTRVVTLIGPAFTIALLGAIESLLSAVVADSMGSTRHDSNQELIGQGIANMTSPVFGGFAATGAIARTATNIRNGATSPLAGIFHALTLIAVLMLLAPLAANIPLTALAAILFVVAWNMSEVQRVVTILRAAPVADRTILLITCTLTVFTDLVVAVNVGVILAVLHFLRRMAQTSETQPVGARALELELREFGLTGLPSGIMVYEIAGPLFFGAVENLRRPLLEARPLPRALIIRLDRVPFMDITGIQTLAEVIAQLRKKAVAVSLCEANERVLAKLRTAGIIPEAELSSAQQQSPAAHFDTLHDALRAAGLGSFPAVSS